jgi:hypothetical protein
LDHNVESAHLGEGKLLLIVGVRRAQEGAGVAGSIDDITGDLASIVDALAIDTL